MAFCTAGVFHTTSLIFSAGHSFALLSSYSDREGQMEGWFMSTAPFLEWSPVTATCQCGSDHWRPGEGAERYGLFWIDCLRPNACKLLTALEYNNVWDMFISSPEHLSMVQEAGATWLRHPWIKLFLLKWGTEIGKVGPSPASLCIVLECGTNGPQIKMVVVLIMGD